MKKFLLPLFALLSMSVNAQQSDSAFSITGKFEKVSSGRMYLVIYGEGGAIKDSAEVNNGVFAFKGNVQKPSTAFLTMKDRREDNLRFYVEPGTMTISGVGDKLKELSISGSVINADDKKLTAFLKPV
ncbi:MAG: DUF4369 domain-containing protein, partial [Ferruginibacter sp.]